MSTPLSNKTFSQLVANCRTILKAYTDEIAPVKLYKELVNDAVDEWFVIGTPKDIERYKESLVLGTVAPGSVSFVRSAGADANYFYTHGTIYLQLGPIGGDVNVSWVGTPGFDSSWIGATVILAKNGVGGGGAGPGGFFRIVSLGNQATYWNCVLDRAYGSDISAVQISGSITKGISIDGTGLVDISSIVKNIERITSVEDSVSGLCLGGEGSGIGEKDFLGITKPGDPNINYSGDIIWYQKGDKLRFARGADIVAYGTLTVNYIRRPLKIAAGADYIDVPDGSIRMLQDMVMLKILGIQKNQPAPGTDLDLTARKLAEMKKANSEERAQIQVANK